jgi:hypothetical protein
MCFCCGVTVAIDIDIAIEKVSLEIGRMQLFEKLPMIALCGEMLQARS